METIDIASIIMSELTGDGSKKGNKKRLEVVEAVVQCIARDGIENTTFDTLSVALKMSRSHLSYYFPTRAAFIDAAVRYATVTLMKCTEARLASAKSWRECIVAAVDGSFDWLERHPEHVSVVALLHYLSTYDASLRQFHSWFWRLGVGLYVSILAPLFDDTETDKRKLQGLAHSVKSLVAGNMLACKTIDPDITLHEARELTKAAVFDLVGAARPLASELGGIQDPKLQQVELILVRD